LAYRGANLPAGHRDLADSRYGVGATLLAQGSPSDALPLLEQAEADLIQVHGAGSARVAPVTGARGECLALTGQVEEGLQMVTQALEVLRRERGEQDRDTQAAHRRWGRVVALRR